MYYNFCLFHCITVLFFIIIFFQNPAHTKSTATHILFSVGKQRQFTIKGILYRCYIAKQHTRLVKLEAQGGEIIDLRETSEKHTHIRPGA